MLAEFQKGQKRIAEFHRNENAEILSKRKSSDDDREKSINESNKKMKIDDGEEVKQQENVICMYAKYLK